MLLSWWQSPAYKAFSLFAFILSCGFPRFDLILIATASLFKLQFSAAIMAPCSSCFKLLLVHVPLKRRKMRVKEGEHLHRIAYNTFIFSNVKYSIWSSKRTEGAQNCTEAVVSGSGRQVGLYGRADRQKLNLNSCSVPPFECHFLEKIQKRLLKLPSSWTS